MIITVSGPPGSGKSTVGKMLSQRLAFEYISVGDLFREQAHKQNMSLAEFGKMAMKNRNIDISLDNFVVTLAKDKNTKNIVFDGRLVGWMLYRNNISAFKIYLTASLDTRAARIAKREHTNTEHVRSEIIERERCEYARYKYFYDIDINNMSIYDIVINTDDKPPEKIVEIILEDMGKRYA